MAHALIKRGVGRGGQAFDRTEIIDCIQAGREYVPTASTGHCLRAQHVVYATGYEAHSMVREYIVDLDNTYALVSDPLVNVYPWNPDWLLWEAKTPYLYLRVTEDNRLLVGGEDDAFHSPTQRDKLIEQKAATIEQKVRELMPDLHWKVDYRWAGTFGKTKDGLAYIGSPKETPGILFALCFGGNGITFSAIASDLISEFIHSGNSPDADLFAFGR